MKIRERDFHKWQFRKMMKMSALELLYCKVLLKKLHQAFLQTFEENHELMSRV